MRYRWLIVLFFISGGLQAQRYVERIYLKDSIGYYEGHVVEQFPGSYIKLYRPVQGDTLVVAIGRILRMSKHFRRLPHGQVRWIDRNKRYYKAVYGEMGGVAVVYSINFDMRIEKGSRTGWGLSAGFTRIGFSLVNSKSPYNLLYKRINMLPVSINYLGGKTKHFMELGVGATLLLNRFPGYQIDEYAFSRNPVAASGMFGHLTAGYRYVPPINGFMLRLTVTPLFGNTGGVYPWGSISIGYQFW